MMNGGGGIWSRRSIARIVALAVAVILLVAFLWPRPTLNRIAVDGHPFFLAGVNYPWKTGQDFGTGGWGHSGVSDPTTKAEVEADFTNMASLGVRVVKWRVFQDGRYGIVFAPDGTPIGLDDYVFKDVDAALQIARQHHEYLVFTLFDSGLWAADCNSQGVQLGGHADLLTDPRKREALVNNVIVPFVRHVSQSNRVIGYEVIAEPDWGVRELNPANDGRIKLSLHQVRSFIRAIIGGIRYQSNALVTVEANRSRDMVAWRGLGLDYYSFSWYDWLEPYDPLNRKASSFGLDRPIVIGEFPAQSKIYSLQQILNIAWQQGYAGAFAWSFTGADQYGSIVSQRQTFTAWLAQHWPAVNLFASSFPTGSYANVPQPYGLNGVRLVNVNNGLFVEAHLFLRNREDATAQLYATPIGQTKTVAEVADVAVPDGSGNATIYLTLPGLSEQKPYKLRGYQLIN